MPAAQADGDHSRNGDGTKTADVAPASDVAPARFSLRALLARHRLFIVILLPAIGLRVVAMLGYRWQVWFNDSFEYVATAMHLQPDPTRPSGYSFLLWVLGPLHSYAAVTILQHVMGVSIGVMVYALARHRFGVPAWIASLAAVPVLYDAFQIQLEHLIMADTPFAFLMTAAVTLVLWDEKPSATRCAIAGLLLGVSAVARSVGLPIVAVVAVYLLIRRIGWRAITSIVIAAALPVVSYVLWFNAWYGQLSMTQSTGVFLYSRVMAFADCTKMKLPTDELALCTTAPPSKRAVSQNYIWRAYSPLDRFPPPEFSPVTNKLAKDFATRAIKAQPFAYVKVVGSDTWRAFGWKRHRYPDAGTYDEYLFSYTPMKIPTWSVLNLGPANTYAAAYIRGNPTTKIVQPFAGIMRYYQRYFYLPGTLLGLVVLAGLAGLVLKWRRLGGEILLPWTVAVALLVVPAATAEFDYRYVLPAVPLACLAAAMIFGPGNPVGDWFAARRGRRPAVVPAGAGVPDDATADGTADHEHAAADLIAAAVPDGPPATPEPAAAAPSVNAQEPAAAAADPQAHDIAG
jgi:hypothetical protein